MARRNNQIKANLKASFGGACQRCGYSRSRRALHFHHTDGSHKRDWSGSRGNAAPAEITAHPERFLLLCANCHIEEHERLDAERKTMVPCPACGTLFHSEACRRVSGRDKYCSRKCQHVVRYAEAEGSHVDRFWKHVEKTESCWNWTAYAIKGAPALAFRNSNGKYAPRMSTRISWEIHRGPIPAGSYVKHSCDNSLCVNPDHLYLTKSPR